MAGSKNPRGQLAHWSTDTPPDDFPASDCHRLDHGFKTRLLSTFVLSHVAQENGVPGARPALRVDQSRLSSTSATGAPIQRTVFELFFLLIQFFLLFFAADSV